MTLHRIALTTLFLTALSLIPARAADNDTSTLTNLQSAYNGESNAAAEYAACAKKADAEGYRGVASLFRAAARSEQAHAAGHAAVIRKMGAEPKADIKTPDVKSTKENLQESIKDETHEHESMYPDYVKQARADNNPGAVRSFTYAGTAEGEHAKLFQQALDQLDQWKDPRTFYVCPTCGYTADQRPADTCPSCHGPADKYEKVQ